MEYNNKIFINKYDTLIIVNKYIGQLTAKQIILNTLYNL